MTNGAEGYAPAAFFYSCAFVLIRGSPVLKLQNKPFPLDAGVLPEIDQ
jgi:hypothetical protein